LSVLSVLSVLSAISGINRTGVTSTALLNGFKVGTIAWADLIILRSSIPTSTSTSTSSNAALLSGSDSLCHGHG